MTNANDRFEVFIVLIAHALYFVVLVSIDFAIYQYGGGIKHIPTLFAPIRKTPDPWSSFDEGEDISATVSTSGLDGDGNVHMWGTYPKE